MPEQGDVENGPATSEHSPLFSRRIKEFAIGLIAIEFLAISHGSDSPTLNSTEMPSEIETSQTENEKGGGGVIGLEAFQFLQEMDYAPDYQVYGGPFPFLGGWDEGEREAESLLDSELTADLIRARDAYDDAVEADNIKRQNWLLGIIDYLEANKYRPDRGNFTLAEQQKLNAQSSVNENIETVRNMYGEHFLSAMETTSGLRVNFFSDKETDNIVINHQSMDVLFEFVLHQIRFETPINNSFSAAIEPFISLDKEEMSRYTLDVIIASDPTTCITLRKGGGYVDENGYQAIRQRGDGSAVLLHQGSRNDDCDALGAAMGHTFVGKYGVEAVDYPHGVMVFSNPNIFYTEDKSFMIGEITEPLDADYAEDLIADDITKSLIHELLHEYIKLAIQGGSTIDPDLLFDGGEGEVDAEHQIFVTPETKRMHEIWEMYLQKGLVDKPVEFNIDGGRR